MEILKLTTLLILIPFGVLLSETASAYPEPFDPIDGAGTTCVLSEMNQPKLNEQNDTSHALARVVVNLISRTGTTPLDQDRETQVHACHLDLDQIETN